MSNIASKLRTLKLELSEELLIYLVLISLPSQFSQFKISYKKWSLNELISYCVQGEERLKQERIESAHVVSISKDKGKRKRIEEPKNEAAKGQAQKKQNQSDNCFFCSKPEHVKKKCTKYHARRAKKGIFLTLF